MPGFCRQLLLAAPALVKPRIRAADDDSRRSGNDQARPSTGIADVCRPDDELMTQMTARDASVTEAAHDDVTVPVSALHQGHGHTGGRTGFRTPNRDQRSAAQPVAAAGHA